MYNFVPINFTMISELCELLEIFKWSKLAQEEIKNHSNSIYMKEIES